MEWATREPVSRDTTQWLAAGVAVASPVRACSVSAAVGVLNLGQRLVHRGRRHFEEALAVRRRENRGRPPDDDSAAEFTLRLDRQRRLYGRPVAAPIEVRVGEGGSRRPRRRRGARVFGGSLYVSRRRRKWVCSCSRHRKLSDTNYCNNFSTVFLGASSLRRTRLTLIRGRGPRIGRRPPPRT